MELTARSAIEEECLKFCTRFTGGERKGLGSFGDDRALTAGAVVAKTRAGSLLAARCTKDVAQELSLLMLYDLVLLIGSSNPSMIWAVRTT